MWCIALAVKAYPTTVSLVRYSLVVGSLFTGTAAWLTFKTLKLLVPDFYNTYTAARPTWLLLAGIAVIIGTWAAVQLALSKKTELLEKKLARQADIDHSLRDAELFKLRQQLQPHFLYNSLNSIAALVAIQPERAQDMIGKLSDFLRHSVKRESEDLLPLVDELQYIKTYLAIEMVRFGERLQVQWEIEPVEQAKIPPFILQPVLENAIKFGLYGTTDQVIIKLSVTIESTLLIITLSNPYDPSVQSPKGTGFGLEGIRRRLYLLFGRTDLMETITEPERFTTILKIPQHV
jgi:LytS/YehU family sensor histidine kinase